MLGKSLIIGAAAFMLSAGATQAATILDPTGDFLPSYSGPHEADLDVTSLSVSYDQSAAAFMIQSTMAGVINPALGGFYVIGINTGSGTGPFASIGAPNVKFNDVVLVQKNGTATIGSTSLASGSVTIGGNALSVFLPLSLLPSTGFDPGHYGFSIWPRSGNGGLDVISDFAPNDAMLAPLSAAPEPAAWLMMLGGFGVIGGALRARRRTRPSFG